MTAFAVRRLTAVLAAGVMVAATTMLMGANRTSAATNPVTATTDCADPGSRTPVLFVHGFHSKPSDFTSYGSPNLLSTIQGLPDMSVSTFDYSAWSNKWVNDSHIGPALGATIACLATKSENDGGTGKVVVVAHSMGGLALREAASLGLPSGSATVGDDIGLAVTVGTPNTGSWILGAANGNPEDRFVSKQLQQLAKWECGINPNATGVFSGLLEVCGLIADSKSDAALAMVPGSSDLARLPPLPASIPLYAVAGDMSLTVDLFNGRTATLLPSIGDILVRPDSALAGAADHTGPLSGTYTDHCGPLDLTHDLSHPGYYGCEHGGLLYDPKVTAQISDELTRYRASVAPPCPAIGSAVDDSGTPTQNAFLSEEQPVETAACDHDAKALLQLMGTGFQGPGGRSAQATEQLFTQDAGTYDHLVTLFQTHPVVDQGGATFSHGGEQLVFARDGGWQSWTGYGSAAAAPAPTQAATCTSSSIMAAVAAYATVQGLGTYEPEGQPTCKSGWAAMPTAAVQNGQIMGPAIAIAQDTTTTSGQSNWTVVHLGEGYSCSELPAAAVKALGSAATCITSSPDTTTTAPSAASDLQAHVVVPVFGDSGTAPLFSSPDGTVVSRADNGLPVTIKCQGTTPYGGWLLLTMGDWIEAAFTDLNLEQTLPQCQS